MSAPSSNEDFQAEVRRRLFPASAFNYPTLPAASHDLTSSLGSSCSDMSQHGLSIAVASTGQPASAPVDQHVQLQEHAARTNGTDNISTRNEDRKGPKDAQQEAQHIDEASANSHADGDAAQKQHDGELNIDSLRALPDKMTQREESTGRQLASAQVSSHMPADQHVSQGSRSLAELPSHKSNVTLQKDRLSHAALHTHESVGEALRVQHDVTNGNQESEQQPDQLDSKALPAAGLRTDAIGRNVADPYSVEPAAQQDASQDRQEVRQTMVAGCQSLSSSLAYSESFEAASEADVPPAADHRALESAATAASPEESSQQGVTQRATF